MLRDAIIIFHKESANIFKDGRAVFANYILPLIIMPAFFVGITFFTSQQQEGFAESSYQVAVQNAPAGFTEILNSQLNVDIVGMDQVNPEESSNNLIVLFPDGGEGQVAVRYAGGSQQAEFALNRIRSAVETFDTSLSQELLAQNGLSLQQLDTYQVAPVNVLTGTEDSAGTEFLATLLPYVIIIYVFAGGMGMGMNVTAGEKERGSLSSLLVNQVSRSSIALGKIFWVIASDLLSALSSFAGIVIAVILAGQILGGTGSGFAIGMNFFSAGNVVGLLLTLMTTSALAAGVIVLLGSIAKNMKEASGYVTPVYLFVILIGVVTMNLDAGTSLGYYFIPLLNSIFVMKGVILSQATAVQIVAMALSNIGLAAILVWLTARLYNSERILNTV